MFVQDNKLSSCKKYFIDRLAKSYPLEEAKSVFEILAMHLLSLDKVRLITEPNMRLTEGDLISFNDALKKLKNNMPIQHIIGETVFYGRTFKVSPDTLIPRPETEELVDWIVNSIPHSQPLKILDIGTGSGCIAISLCKEIPNSVVHAVDISDAALMIAKENAINLKADLTLDKLDILKDNPSDHFHIIVSNPPYVRYSEKLEMEKRVKDNEPNIALFVEDDDPLVFYRRILDVASTHLMDGGSLYFEINQYLGKATMNLMMEYGFLDVELKKDLYGNDRMLRGTKV